MIHPKEDIQPLTTFRNNSLKMMQQVKRTGRPIVLTVNGKTAAVVQSADAYQRGCPLKPGGPLVPRKLRHEWGT